MPVTKKLQEGQAAYRETQKKAKSLGLRAKGSHKTLLARIEAHEAKAEAKIQQLEEAPSKASADLAKIDSMSPAELKQYVGKQEEEEETKQYEEEEKDTKEEEKDTKPSKPDSANREPARPRPMPKAESKTPPAVEAVRGALKDIQESKEAADNPATSPELRDKFKSEMLAAAATLRKNLLYTVHELGMLTPEHRVAYSIRTSQTAHPGGGAAQAPRKGGGAAKTPRAIHFDTPSLASDASAPDVTAAQPVAHAAAEPADDQEQPIVTVDQAAPTGPQVVEGPPLPPVVYTEPVTDSYVTEGLSRDGPSTGMPMTAQHAVEMDKEDGEGKSTDRLKDEIKAMHLVYNHKVKEFLEKAHQSAMHRALLSHDADTVRGHHRGMLEAIAKYYASGKGNGMRIGVVVSAEQYMAKFGGGGGGAAAGGGGATPNHCSQDQTSRRAGKR
jgi:hypothetical protein